MGRPPRTSHIPGHSGQRMIAYSAGQGTPSEAALRLLADHVTAQGAVPRPARG